LALICSAPFTDPAGQRALAAVDNYMNIVYKIVRFGCDALAASAADSITAEQAQGSKEEG
jgi:hypothetical protein